MPAGYPEAIKSASERTVAVCAERERRAGEAGNPQAQSGKRDASARNRRRFDFVEAAGVEFHTFKMEEIR
jgi:hypothetical protein